MRLRCKGPMRDRLLCSRLVCEWQETEFVDGIESWRGCLCLWQRLMKTWLTGSSNLIISGNDTPGVWGLGKRSHIGKVTERKIIGDI